MSCDLTCVRAIERIVAHAYDEPSSARNLNQLDRDAASGRCRGALLRKVRHVESSKFGWVFTFAAAAYNLVRMRNLSTLAVRTA
jgi:hypothetical protein